VVHLKYLAWLHDIHTRDWQTFANVKDWWVQVVHKRGEKKEEMAEYSEIKQ
jgi:hypothetical protein